jgi:putative Mg2+ transporter-C (MgtC) family protein
MQALNPFVHQFWTEIGVAVLCGALVGLEREWRGKPTGMRTCILICLGTALFVRLGSVMTTDKGDASRVLGQVVTGIGFLGAGVIMSHGEIVVGVTTASVVWILAATGALIGAGEFGAAIAIAFVTIGTLILFDFIERPLQRLRRNAPLGLQSPPAPSVAPPRAEAKSLTNNPVS